MGSGKILRQLVAERVDRSIQFVGTPDQVAERMGEVMEVGETGASSPAQGKRV